MNAVFESEVLRDGSTIRVIRAKPVRIERDRRAMNHMDPETKSVHIRLDEWADWVKRALTSLGFPSESYYSKWAALQIAPEPGFEAPMPERPANVDRAVARLCEIDRAVIWRYYCQFRPDKIWRGLHAIESQSGFDRILKRARMRVSGFLLAIDKQV